MITGALDIANVPVVAFEVKADVSLVDKGFRIDRGTVKLGDDIIRIDGLVTAAGFGKRRVYGDRTGPG